MSTNSSSFVGDIPGHYDTGLGPNIFADYADRLVGLCRDSNVRNALELAAGTGIVSRKLRNALPPEADLVVTDLNPPMLDVAKGKFVQGENVEFHVANAMDIPFDSNEFDLMVCQFGVMFFLTSQRHTKKRLGFSDPVGVMFSTFGAPCPKTLSRKWLMVLERCFFQTIRPASIMFPFIMGTLNWYGAIWPPEVGPT
ncbi:MAG: class I SAM-dependent methyltransferase [Tateyamaria sp.]|uniref:class I SAM-dependent methyltransferase n=1 Tax=Tateyamaria sp. TaxID=1929288 RepID=UPI00327BC21F